MAAPPNPNPTWGCPACTFENKPTRFECEMCGTKKPEEPSFTTAKFKKFMGNVASTSKLFTMPTAKENTNTTNTNNNTTDNNTTNSNNSKNNTKSSSKSTQELQEEIEILKLQKEDLRKLVQERTYELDQLKKLDTEHQKLRQRWKDNEEKSVNDVANITAYSEDLKKELTDLKNQNAVLQSKQTNNDLIKNKLENKLREVMDEQDKTKKLLERKTQEKKMLVAEVLKLRNEKQELITLYKAEIDKLNLQNQNNIDQLSQLHEQQKRSDILQHESEIKGLNNKYDELNLIYTNYKHNITEKITNINSTTNAFETMINNANVGNLSQDECNKILDNIINSIESMENENEKYHQVLHKRISSQTDLHDDDVEDEGEAKEIDQDVDGLHNLEDLQDKAMTPGSTGYNYKTDMDEDMLLNKIESRVLKTLREKALLQRSSNELIFQLQQLQTSHEEELKVKDDIIQQYELKNKVSFFKRKQST